jgi:hypothetical protein
MRATCAERRCEAIWFATDAAGETGTDTGIETGTETGTETLTAWDGTMRSTVRGPQCERNKPQSGPEGIGDFISILNFGVA